jgi:hypothetical protein
MNRYRLTAIALIILIAGALRLGGLSHYDLWLDEIWSVTTVDPTGPITAIATIRHDNNHLLNSGWIWLIGPAQSPVLYRLASFVASIIAVWLACSLSVVFGILLACSYPFVLYGSEARGYSFTVMGILLCAVSVRSRQPTRRSVLQFWCGSIVGLLGHLTFFFALPSLLLLAACRDRGQRMVLFLRLFPVGVLAIWIIWSFIPGMTVGGGPRGSVIEALLNGIAVTFGANEMSVHDLEGSVRTLAVVLVGITAGVVGVVFTFRAEPMLGLAVGVAAFAVPAFWLLAFPPEFALPRYFLVSLLFLLWGCSWFFEYLVRRDFAAQIMALLLLIGFCAGGTLQARKLFRLGRGDPLNLLLTASKSMPQSSPIHLSSNSAFRVGMVVRYYATALGAQERFRVSDRSVPTPTDGSLFISEQLDRAAPIATIAGAELLAAYPAAPLSGLPWALYRSTHNSDAS